MNRRVANHPIEGTVVPYRPFEPPYAATQDAEGGTLIIGNGMDFEIVHVYPDWNDIKGLTIFYGRCPQTEMFTHLSERELGVFLVPA